jgi:hypothetical protein
VVGPSFDPAGGASFGLFRRSPVTGAYDQIAAIRGGYGTTGQEVCFALPLQDLNLLDGGDLSRVSAFTALGSYGGGPASILSKLRLSP